MSSISMDAPIVKINSFGLQNIISFIYTHEGILKEFGAIKIQLSSDCTLALKKRKISPTCTTTQKITKLNDDESIYSVDKVEAQNLCNEQRSPITDEKTFWSSLSNSDHIFYLSNVSILPNQTLFYKKQHRKYFAIHSIPRQSLLKLAGSKIVNQFVPCLTRTHGPGAVFPLSSAQQHLSLLVYHHQGSPRHWYIIPAYERDALTKILQRENSSICFEHQKLLINPLLFDNYHIRYHRLVQCQNEFVVLSAGALTQSFTEDASWNESIPFALPSWIEDGHAYYSDSTCQCCINNFYEPITIDITLFKHELIQKYIDKYLNIDNDGNTSINKGYLIIQLSIRF
ncbi:unnamed protein product [Rotaria sp. Silwood1]|nr:unnamed protein product [Rotaria sp. Silwood1]CAF1647749.1 unnamed protein product [Rotaria sp. Silwood1]CAF3937811.1 unnamed protein product [Rotaria sp. Silwood1]CAF4020669.1 unnamed protein product [Rotaria sp. Silwood1]CAF4976710.1 unnamed protein product [Rotaria sp. Silwood1]